MVQERTFKNLHSILFSRLILLFLAVKYLLKMWTLRNQNLFFLNFFLVLMFRCYVLFVLLHSLEHLLYNFLLLLQLLIHLFHFLNK